MSPVSFEVSVNSVKMPLHRPGTCKPSTPSVSNESSRNCPTKPQVHYDFLKQLPFEAVTQLAKLLNIMEQEALLPTQLRMVSIVMIPKNPKVERPIALTSCLYRLWNRVRNRTLSSGSCLSTPSCPGTMHVLRRTASPLQSGGCFKASWANTTISTPSLA